MEEVTTNTSLNAKYLLVKPLDLLLSVTDCDDYATVKTNNCPMGKLGHRSSINHF